MANDDDTSTSLLLGHLFRLDLESKKLYCGEELIFLEPKEYLVLECLLKNRGITCTREMLRNHIYRGRKYRGRKYRGGKRPDSNVIDSFVYKLRQKLKAADPQGTQYIITVRGQGYSLK